MTLFSQPLIQLTFNFLYVGFCNVPQPPTFGSLVENISIPKEVGTNVSYTCNQGYVPSAVFSSTCTSPGLWMPDPVEHICTRK